MPIRNRPLSRLFTVPPTGELPAVTPVSLPGRGQTAVFDTGPRDDPVVVLLHALACTALLNWYPAVPELARRYRVIGLDLRWHGGGIRSPEFSLEDCADDVVALADALGVSRFTAVGYSMGALVAQLLARRHPERLDGMVLCAAASSFRRNPRHLAVLDAYGRSAAMWQARARTGYPGRHRVRGRRGPCRLRLSGRAVRSGRRCGLRFRAGPRLNLGASRAVRGASRAVRGASRAVRGASRALRGASHTPRRRQAAVLKA